MKTCTKCNTKKPTDEFYRNKKGYNAECKECKKNIVRSKKEQSIKDRHFLRDLEHDKWRDTLRLIGVSR